MIEYSYSRAELLNSIPAYILDTSSKKDIVSILCKMLKLDIVRCSNIKFVKSKRVTSKLKFNYDE